MGNHMYIYMHSYIYVWATNPEIFGLAPPTGSEEERCEEGGSYIGIRLQLTQCPRLVMYDTDTEKDVEPDVLSANVGFSLCQRHIGQGLYSSHSCSSHASLSHNLYICLIKSAGEGASKICFKDALKIVDKKLEKLFKVISLQQLKGRPSQH